MVVLIGARELLEGAAVDLLGPLIVRRQADVALCAAGVEAAAHAALQPLLLEGRRLIVAQVIEQRHEALVLLAIDLL